MVWVLWQASGVIGVCCDVVVCGCGRLNVLCVALVVVVLYVVWFGGMGIMAG